ncbi:LOW QUALITY PROTEIN: hypothetical protein TorRG33x02_012120 [Trema orientale]|uniref:Uncharacterized protein n=1 Tax=Trema orientale TaxID=63057 RepID=A0A2P5FZD9_TREOI|nr:LOW QUALITY PROTEIN: hypothetical protein TorRG33x02_012120 [Trema orientale]
MIRPEDLLDQVPNRKSDEYDWIFFHASRLLLAAGVLLNTEEPEPVTLKAIIENLFTTNSQHHRFTRSDCYSKKPSP